MANNKRKAALIMPAFGTLPFNPTGGVPATPIDGLFIGGSFLTNGGSDPVAASNRGHPFSVVRTSAGLYTVTLGGATLFAGKYTIRQIVSLQTTLGKGAAGSALRAVPGLLLELTAGTFQIRIEDAAGAATDLAAGTDNRVNFIAFCINGGR